MNKEKKNKGILKKALVVTPIVAGLSLLIASNVLFAKAQNQKDAMASFRHSDAFMAAQIEDLEKLQDQYLDGQLDKTQYLNEVDYVTDSDEYFKKAMEKNEDYQNILKNYKLFYRCGVGTIITMVGVLVGGILLAEKMHAWDDQSSEKSEVDNSNNILAEKNDKTNEDKENDL